jgi:hypothetical protein
MKKTLKRTSVFVGLAVVMIFMQFGCKSNCVGKTGFLTTYSNLQKETDVSFINMDKQQLTQYSYFIVDDVRAYFPPRSQAIAEQTRGVLTQAQINELTDHMHSEIVKAVRNAGYAVVPVPGDDVARISVALTDVEGLKLRRLLPVSRMTGAGVGAAAMEAEIVDSMTNRQVAAVVELQEGSKFPLVNIEKWDAAKQVITDWAKKFEMRLDAVHRMKVKQHQARL